MVKLGVRSLESIIWTSSWFNSLPIIFKIRGKNEKQIQIYDSTLPENYQNDIKLAMVQKRLCSLSIRQTRNIAALEFSQSWKL